MTHWNGGVLSAVITLACLTWLRNACQCVQQVHHLNVFLCTSEKIVTPHRSLQWLTSWYFCPSILLNSESVT